MWKWALCLLVSVVVRTHDARRATHMPVHAAVTLQSTGTRMTPALAGHSVTRRGKCTVLVTLTLLATASRNTRVTMETRSTPAEMKGVMRPVNHSLDRWTDWERVRTSHSVSPCNLQDRPCSGTHPNPPSDSWDWNWHQTQRVRYKIIMSMEGQLWKCNGCATLLVLRVEERTCAGFTVIGQASHHTVKARSTSLTLLSDCVILTILHTTTH